MKKIVFVAGVMIFSACVTTDLTPEGQKVRITSNPDVVRPCKFIGE